MVILLAFFFGGISLAFALGSRQLVENLLARRSLDRYRIGDLVRVNGSEGRIIEMLSTAVVIETAEGVVTIPARRFVDGDVRAFHRQYCGRDIVAEPHSADRYLVARRYLGQAEGGEWLPVTIKGDH